MLATLFLSCMEKFWPAKGSRMHVSLFWQTAKETGVNEVPERMEIYDEPRWLMPPHASLHLQLAWVASSRSCDWSPSTSEYRQQCPLKLEQDSWSLSSPAKCKRVNHDRCGACKAVVLGVCSGLLSYLCGRRG